MLQLDDTMHVHVGYYEDNLDIEAVFYQCVDTGKWILFFDHESYNIRFKGNEKRYNGLGRLVGKYKVEDAEIEKVGYILFERFLKENDIIR
ncbi:DUF3986 family protein [Bacillus sp. 179-C3.3 HS]|uniref:DUF3986 family protein n=1 Tax=Bacillus sp. 179-C3.3 HS TaxID=3232162 RepID=UPI0039A2AD63